MLVATIAATLVVLAWERILTRLHRRKPKTLAAALLAVLVAGVALATIVWTMAMVMALSWGG